VVDALTFRQVHRLMLLFPERRRISDLRNDHHGGDK
jgi:hypothetical protein